MPRILYIRICLVLLSITDCTSSHHRLREYTFNIYYVNGAPDGVFKQILTVNGQFPGPTITADVNDILRVTVVNQIQDGQNTTIHWHGIHHKDTPFEDGPSQITQCPIKNGYSQVYEFPLKQSGTYWYHAHVNSQYTEGLWGALIIKKDQKVEIYPYDEEITITLTDWYHLSAHKIEEWYLSPRAREPPFPDGGLLNGVGRSNCDIANHRAFTCNVSNQKRHIFNVKPGKRYKFRVINTAAFSNFRFSIDDHKLSTIEVDGTDTFLVPTDMAILGPGQRYAFLVDTKYIFNRQFLIRADLMAEDLFDNPKKDNITPFPHELIPNITAVLNYVGFRSYWNSTGLSTLEPFNYRNVIPERKLPIYKADILDENNLTPFDQQIAPDYYDQEVILNSTFTRDENDVTRGSFNNTPFKYPTRKPLLMSMVLGDEIPRHANPIHIEYGQVIQIRINNPSGPHPLHLHGHSFWVLGSGKPNDGNYDPAKHKLTLTGARRDTVNVAESSWVVIRFVADNPGLWTFHCHIDWHNLTGMIVTFIEGREQAMKKLKIPNEARNVCAAHGIYV